MTGMGFDGLVVNHGGLNEVTDQLRPSRTSTTA